MASAIPFRRRPSGEPIDALSGARILVSSRGRGWQGVLAEQGENGPWETDGLAVEGHYVAVNLASDPLRFEVHRGSRVQRVVMAPGSLWVNPHGRPFTHRVPGGCSFGALVLAPTAVDASVAPEYGLEDGPLLQLARSLLWLAARRHGEEPLAAEVLGAAVAQRLAARAGGRPDRERLGAGQLRAVAERVEAGLDGRLRLADLAAVAGLSAFHFARAFRATVGEPPHRWVVARRLDRARDRLRAGERPGEVAVALGFADQAHLTRLFRRRFGTTPGAMARAAIGPRPPAGPSMARIAPPGTSSASGSSGW
jgi:AraC family transcriptional regulator